MKKFKVRQLAFLSLSALIIAAGCGNNNTVNKGGAENPPDSTVESAAPAADKLDIKVSFYPMYEFTKNVAGDLADVETLIPAGIEPHDWEPTAQDMAGISDADMFIYSGAGMESWAEQVIQSTSGTKLITVEASKGLSLIEGTEEGHHEESHDDEHHEEEHNEEHNEEHHEEGLDADAHEEEGHHHDGLDPHVWLNPVLAIQQVRTIETALSKAAPEHAAEFKANADEYTAKLAQLDQDFRNGLKDSKRKDFITQHAAFGYLAGEYGLTQVPIAGLSPEQEPSAAKMAEIVEFAKQHQVKTIFFETLVSSSVADTLSKEIGAKAAVLNPIEGLTDEDRSSNLDYVALMRQNLQALQGALNE